MSNKLLLCGGTLFGGLSLWCFFKAKKEVKKELYGSVQGGFLAMLMKFLLKPLIKKAIPLLF